MTDDQWRRGREDEDFGPPLFSEGEGGDDSASLSFGDGDTGPLPHWTQPPTGELTRVVTSEMDTSTCVISSSSRTR